jgi:hypothetical protein
MEEIQAKLDKPIKDFLQIGGVNVKEDGRVVHQIVVNVHSSSILPVKVACRNNLTGRQKRTE